MKLLRLITFLAGFCTMYPALAGDMAASAAAAGVDAAFSDIERQVIERYYGKRPPVVVNDDRDEQGAHGKKDKKGANGKNKGMPSGMAKRDGLPPGLAKRDKLPPGLEKRVLPDDLDRVLPPVRPGYERRIILDVDHAVMVLIHTATGTVADIIKDVMIPGH